MTTDASAGLTRLYVRSEDLHSHTAGCDNEPPHGIRYCEPVYCATPADALLADLRGKLEAEQAMSRGLREVLSRRGKSHMPVLLLQQQLEAKRAKVRELQERADTAVRSWWVYMAAETDTERDEAYEMMSDAIAALPASVDAKGDAK
jgi:hypothetical protein